MQRLTSIIICAVLALGFATAAYAAGATQTRRHFSEAEKADLKRVSDYLNAMHSMKGDFVQVNPDGTLWQGVFYLSKPGRVRFEYKPPNAHLVVADGSALAVEDSKLHTVDRYPLVGSPLALLLSDNIDLTQYTHINGVRHQPGLLLVSASAASGGTRGDITITFSDPGLELRQWEVLDSEGYKTTVVLDNMQTGMALAPALFVIHEIAQRKSQN
jgi:outer membrane lipoprotein-sorting protein